MNHNLKSKSALLIFAFAILIVCLWLAMGPTGSPLDLTSAAQVGVKSLPDGRPAPVDLDATQRGVKDDFGPDTNAIMAFAAALMKPFEFHGKVVDQYGNPVSDANVKWGAANNPDPYKSGTRGTTQAGSQGHFSISSNGIGLHVEVSKPGYDRVPSELGGGKRGSYGGFKHGGPMGNTDFPMGTKDSPSIFVLRKMGETVPLVHIAEQSVLVPKNGSAVGVDLETGQTTNEGTLKVQCWTNDRIQNSEGQYEWKCAISVPGGGLVERTGESVFESPADGYQESVQLTPSPAKWASNVEREYFVKLPDGCFGRINFRMRTGGEHFFVIESFLNPTPGDRNLEFDPAKAVTVP